MPDINEIKTTLQEANHSITEDCRLGNNSGTRLRLAGGQIVNVFDNGNIQIQGRNQEPVKQLLQPLIGGESAQQSNKVFVVYGHDQTARDQLESMLRRWGLEPVILDQLPSEGQTIIEKLERLQGDVQYAVVLATPDDEGHRAGHPDEKSYRARQNVVMELGMLLTKLGRPRVAILLKQQENMERPSDIQGLIYIPYRDRVDDARVQLAQELSAQGFNIPVAQL